MNAPEPRPVTGETPDVGLSGAERELIRIAMTIGYLNPVCERVEAILTARLAAAEAAHARDLAALAEMAEVCDAYGLPHSAAGLDRHLTGNAALTIENWKATAAGWRERAEVAEAKVAAVERLAREWDLTEFPDEATAAMMRFDLAVALTTSPGRSGTADPEART